jgi:lipoyl-dependent peroxiredoxin
MPTREAHTTWTGTLQDGGGKVDLLSSRAARFDVSFPRRAAAEAKGVTSPEELIAAAHSSCYAMQLSALIADAGGVPEVLQVDARVNLGPDPAGGFRLTAIQLSVAGVASGVSPDAFIKLAEQAKVSCPVSKALTGVDISLDVALG